MGIALTLELAGSRAGARLEASGFGVAAAGLLLSAIQFTTGPTLAIEGPPALRLSIAAVLALVAAVPAWRAAVALRRAPRPSGETLQVDEAGRAMLTARGAAAGRPMILRSSCRLPGLIVLVLAPYPGQAASRRTEHRPVTLLLGRDALPDDAWRHLSRWLRWMERGRHAAPIPLSVEP